MAKRCFDLIAAAFGLVLLSPVLAAAALAIVADSPGPVFYRGVRTGRFGRPFRMFKFRTMVLGAERLGGGTSGLGDPRVTRVGRFLRRYKIDELPQLINVVTGDMSLVGPRPELPVYTDRFTGDEKLILSVRPGLTDYSSIRFSSLDKCVGAQDVDRVFEEKILPEKNRLRVRYVKEQGFFTDLTILWRTAVVLFAKVKG